ncbi:hypothetical protein BBP40_004748 [Aspergillus hancockii]|nr:hypothetical protein BBP40_004748 [Aspergillus hancockii]
MKEWFQQLRFVTLDVFTTKSYLGNALGVVFRPDERDAEIPFAGHPTIGAASWFLHHTPSEPDKKEVRQLITKSGEIPISRQTVTNDAAVVARIAHSVRRHATRFPLLELMRLHPSLVPFFPQADSEALAAVKTSTGGESIPIDGTYLDEGWQSGHCMAYFFVRDIKDSRSSTNVIRTRVVLGNTEDAAAGRAASGGVSLADRGQPW